MGAQPFSFILSLVLILLLSLSLVACSGAGGDSSGGGSAAGTEESTSGPTDGGATGGSAGSTDGATDDGSTSTDAGTDDGATDDGSTSTDAGTDDGATDDGSTSTDAGTDDGATDDGSTSTDAGTDDGATDDGSTSTDDGTDDGATDDGSTSTDDGTDNGATGGITGGVVVDPYIVGATFFEDVNGNGRWDEGEQISSPSDEHGRFTFDTPVPAGHTIIMLGRGTHQGLPFTGQMRHLVTEEDSGNVVVTPLTTLLTQAFTEGDISSLLNLLNGYQDYDFAVDPMAGLAELNGSVNEAELFDLRANLYVGALLDLFQVSREFDELDYQNLEPNHDELLHGLREGLRYATDPAAQNAIAALLPAGYNLPPVTMREVAETMPAILNWWKQELITKALQDLPVAVSVDEFKELVDSAQAELGRHYYLRHHKDDAEVQGAIDAGWLPEVDAAYVAISRNNTVVPVESINYEAVSGQSLKLGDDSRLRFFKSPEGDLGAVELTFGGGSLNGTWRIEAEADDLAVLILEDEDASLELELEANRHSHLSLRVKARADDYDQTRFLGRLLLEAGGLQVS